MEDSRFAGGLKGSNYPWVALEGIDGCGKSTQVKIVSEYFNASAFRFPTNHSVIAEALRTENPIERMLIFMADMVSSAVKIREIKNGGVVISDRSVISTYAYQSGDDYSARTLYHMVNVPSLFPDLVIYVRIPLEEAIARIEKRSREDGIEISEFERYDKLAKTYEQMEIITEIESAYVVDGMLPKEEVSRQIIRRIEDEIRSL